MTEEPESFPLMLGGRRWDLPHFTFGVIRRLQPRLMRLNAPFAKETSEPLAARLDEDTLEGMLGVVADAIALVDPAVSRETLDALRFSSNDLISAQTAVMRACGLVRASAPAGGEDAPKA